MEYAASFLDGRGKNWNYNSLKNFHAISTPVQHHLQRVRLSCFVGGCGIVVLRILVYWMLEFHRLCSMSLWSL